MSGQVIDLSLAAAARRRRTCAAMVPSPDACTRVVTAPAATPTPLPSVAVPGDPVTLPSHHAPARVQRVSSSGESTVLPFLSLHVRAEFVERAAVVLGCAGAVLLLGIRLAGGA